MIMLTLICLMAPNFRSRTDNGPYAILQRKAQKTRSGKRSDEGMRDSLSREEKGQKERERNRGTINNEEENGKGDGEKRKEGNGEEGMRAGKEKGARIYGHINKNLWESRFGMNWHS